MCACACCLRKVISEWTARFSVHVLLVFLFWVSFLFSGAPHAASPDDFRTPEYLKNGRAYDWIKAADAYALGFSGKGVTVGVLDDSAWPEHPEFAGKSSYPIVEIMPSNFASSHGIHTAGTVFAAKNGYGMHGVAWGANPVSVVMAFGDDEAAAAGMSAFLDFPQISVINNSWGYPVFPTDFISPSPELVRTMRDA
ncbi:MAG: S8 family serine peptidase, partial [Zoogloeaceae bacterium]|nr:S8 family serine peptidase [Zoogloeaceae bacterium]